MSNIYDHLLDFLKKAKEFIWDNGIKKYITDDINSFKGKDKNYIVREIIRRIVMITALSIFVYSSYEVTGMFLDYREDSKDYENMEEMFEIPNVQGSSSNDTSINGGTISNSNAEVAWKYDYNALLAMNSDAVGWIKQDNIISYPIVMGTDNTYYLSHNAAHKANGSGSIFVDYRVDGGLDAWNAIIYGHDMKDFSMFGSLTKYMEKDYADAHPTIDIYVKDVGYRYYVFAAYETDAVGDTYSYNFANEQEFINYVNLVCMPQRRYETAIKEVQPTDKIVTLSTCTRNGRNTRRMVVQAVRGEQLQ